MNAKQIALMSMLIALSVIGRLFFTFVPNVQPTTTIVILSSFILTPTQAVIVAMLGALVSNLFLGMGFWSIYQMIAWAIIGLISGLVGKYHEKIPLPILILYAGFTGLLYGFMISIPSSMVVDVNFYVYYMTGLPFDLGHAYGNMIFFALMYPIFFKTLKKSLDKHKL